MQLFDVYPLNDITISRATGSHVYDDAGHRYLDLYGGHAVISIGHSHPHYVSGLTQQLERVGFYSNSVKIPQQQALATLLGRVSCKTDYQLFLCNSGAEANENAMKLASFVTGRKKIVAFTKAFHGRTSLAVAATDNPNIIAPVNQTDNIIFLPFNDAAAVEQLFATQGDTIAAVITEGIQGVGGIHEAGIPFLQAIRKCCTAYGSVYIADSVQCGYGRTGIFYAHDYSDTRADIYTMAKGMGNGFPVAAISIAPHIQPKHFMLGTTFGGNHLACAAAIAVLEVIEQEQLMQNAAVVGQYLIDKLRQMEGITEVRGRGLMIGIALPPERSEVKKNLLFRHRIFTGEAKPNVIRLLPALNLTKEDADLFCHALKQELQ
jgi:acetylornithine/N-succinyldiaminopimelate aminotransferase